MHCDAPATAAGRDGFDRTLVRCFAWAEQCYVRVRLARYPCPVPFGLLEDAVVVVVGVVVVKKMVGGR